MEILSLIREIDAAADSSSQSSWAQKRVSERRKFKAPCEVRINSAKGDSGPSTPARTRDISTSGLGFVAEEQFDHQTPVVIEIHLSNGITKRLSGTAVFSRRVRGDWYHTGVSFVQGDEPAREPVAGDQESATSKERRKQNDETERPGAKLTSRDRALQMLESISKQSAPEKEQISKVLELSTSSDHVVRHASIPALMQIGGKQAIRAMVDLLNDNNATIQGSAADALGYMQTTAAIDSLQKLLQFNNDEVGIRAAEALAKMDDISGQRIACEVLASDDPLNHRAARALGITVGQNFRPNAEGLAAASQYVKANRL